MTDAQVTELLSKAENESTPSTAGLTPELKNLLSAVDATYRQFERAQDLRLKNLGATAGELNTARLELQTGQAQHQARMREADRRFESLVQVASDAYWEQDAEFRFTLFSPGTLALVGRDPTQWIGRTRWADVPHVEDDPNWVRHRATLQAHAPFRDFTYAIDVPGRGLVHFSVSGAPVFDAAGAFTGYRGIARDVSVYVEAEQRLRETLQLTEALLDAAPTPITIKDAEQRFTHLNGAYERMFEMKRSEALGNTARALRGDAAAASEGAEQRLFNEAQTTRYEQSLVLPSGKQVRYQVTKAPVFGVDGRLLNIITTLHDITELKAAQERLAEQLRMTHTIIDAAPMPISIKDANLRFSVINTAYERLFKVNRDDMLGRTAQELGLEGAGSGKSIEEQMRENPGLRNYSRTRPLPDGSVQHFVITKATLTDEDGAVTGFITMHADVSELKNAERAAEEQLRLTNILLDASPMPLVVKDRDLNITLVNSAYEHMFGVKREDVLNQGVSRQRSDLAQEIERIERELLVKGGIHQIERALPLRTGSTLNYIINKSTFSNREGEVSGVITTFTDITELKRTEENLIRARELAETAVKTRSQFLANMSHEIRTPMNGVLGMVSLLSATALDTEQAEFVDTIKTSGEGLLKIINDILDFSKMEAGKVEIEDTVFDLNSRVAGIIQLFTASAREKALALTHDIAPDVPHLIHGDPVRISQVLSNLIGNAIKFTARGSVRVMVRVAGREQDNITLQFDVHDTGIGIAADALVRIFEPFLQADASTTRRFGGTGLGLTISRQLAELMGGSMTVDSKPGSGSRFGFSVQVRAAAALEQPADAQARAHDTRAAQAQVVGALGMHVLLAEDNPVNQTVTGAMLRKLGCTIILAGTGAQALAHVQSGETFDVIMMDCHMPEMDGYAATAAIRAWENDDNRRTHNIIIAQTANAMDGDRQGCIAAGMDDYISKPFTTATLGATLARWKANSPQINQMRDLFS